MIDLALLRPEPGVIKLSVLGYLLQLQQHQPAVAERLRERCFASGPEAATRMLAAAADATLLSVLAISSDDETFAEVMAVLPALDAADTQFRLDYFRYSLAVLREQEEAVVFDSMSALLADRGLLRRANLFLLRDRNRSNVHQSESHVA